MAAQSSHELPLLRVESIRIPISGVKKSIPSKIEELHR